MNALNRFGRLTTLAVGTFALVCGALLLSTGELKAADEDRASEVRVVAEHEWSELIDAWTYQRPPDELLTETQRAYQRQSRRLASDARRELEDAQKALGRHDQGTAAKHLAAGLDLLAELSDRIEDSRQLTRQR